MHRLATVHAHDNQPTNDVTVSQVGSWKFTVFVSVKCLDPKTKSFDTVKQCVADPLLAGKLSFYLSVANQVNPFLTAYQTDKPMLPFLCASLYKMVKTLMDRLVKDDVMAPVSSVQQLLKIDTGLKENHKVWMRRVWKVLWIRKQRRSVTKMWCSVVYGEGLRKHQHLSSKGP